MSKLLGGINGLMIFLVALSLGLSGCGGGGGGGSTGGGGSSSGGGTGMSYTGKTSQATVSAANATSLSTGAFNGSGSGVAGIGLSLQNNSHFDRSLVFIISRTLEESFLNSGGSSGSGNIARTVINDSGTIPGDCGGNVSYSTSIDDTSGAFNGTFSYNNYCVAGVTMSGGVTYTGTIDLMYGTMQLTASFNNLSVISECGSYTSEGYINYSIDSTTVSGRMNTLTRDDSTGKVYKVEDYIVTITSGWDYVDMAISGRYYDPDYGYVTVSTDTVFRIYSGDIYPSQGVLHITGYTAIGGGSTKARLTVVSPTQYQVDADTDGDGIYDWSTGALNWSDGCVSGADTTPPSVPSGLNANAVSSSRIELTWNASTDDVGVSGYNIYRGGVLVGSSGTTSYSDTGLNASTQYCYSVSAFDAAGNESGKSSQACATTFAPTVATWAKFYGGTDSYFATSIQQTTDGGYIVAGDSDSYSKDNYDFWVFKLDASGNVTWQKTYGGTNYEFVYAIQQTKDGGYIVAGGKFSYSYYAWVLKLDAGGNVTWQKTYGSETGFGHASSIQQTKDGGYIIAGQTYLPGTTYPDFWVFKLDASGNVTWQKTYGGSNWDFATSIQQTSDGGYIVAGGTASFGDSNGDVWVLKLDAGGNVTWQKTYGSSLYWDGAASIQQTSEGGYIVVGGTGSYNIGDVDIWILKLDASGNVTWQKTYGSSYLDDATSIQQTSDGGYIVAGYYSYSIIGGTNYPDLWVFKLDASGNITWQKTYGGGVSSWNEAWSARETSDGGYIVLGSTDYFGAGNGDVWVLKLDGNGDIGGSCGLGVATNATVTDTTVTPGDTTATVTDTATLVTTTTVVPQDTTATTATQCSSP